MNNEYDVPVPSTICIPIYQSNHKRWICDLTLQGGRALKNLYGRFRLVFTCQLNFLFIHLS